MEAPLGSKEEARARLQYMTDEESPTVKATPLTSLSDVLNRYQQEEPARALVKPDKPVFTDRGGADDLEDLLTLSLKEARKLIETEWNYDDPRFVTAKSGMIQSIFATATKVDDTQLRRRQIDMLPKLLELMAQEEKKLPPMIEATRE